MSLRSVINPAKAALRICPAGLARAAHPNNIAFIRSKSDKKKDERSGGICKHEKCGAINGGQFFAGCCQEIPRKPCPVTKQRGGNCKGGCNSRCRPGK